MVDPDAGTTAHSAGQLSADLRARKPKTIDHHRTGNLTMSEQLRKEIRVCLKEAGLSNLSKDVLSKCVSLASTLHVSAVHVAECWEAHSLNKNVKNLDEHSFASFRAQLIKTSDNAVFLTESVNDGSIIRTLKKHEASVVTPASNKRQHVEGGPSAQVSGNRRISMSPNTPLLRTTTGNASSIQPSMHSYENRKGSGTVVAEYNPMNLQSTQKPDLSQPRCLVVHDFSTNVKEPYRHLFTVVEERARALDNYLIEKQEQFSEKYNFGSEELAALEAVNVPRQDKICCVGRICNASHEGRINAASVLLEGSRHMSGGSRVELDLSYMKAQKQAFSLFPGQIVAVEGMNCSGRKFVAQRICEGAPHAPVKSRACDLLKFHHDVNFQDGKPLTIISAAGPFTCSDNLDYVPLGDLFREAIRSKADVVILAGPFVDVRHKEVAGGCPTVKSQEDDAAIVVPYETIFLEMISSLIEDFYDDSLLETQFILVPSLEDATAESVYPQAPLSDRYKGGVKLDLKDIFNAKVGYIGLEEIEKSDARPRRIHCVSNPCTLTINEVVIGVTGTDVLFHMNADETNSHLESGSRMNRISQHLLKQRSYYPLFPGSLEINMDLKRMDQWSMPCAPDILILPSKLAPFCKPLVDDSTIVINPGLLTKTTTGGTYAIISVHPFSREILEKADGDDGLRHNLHERASVEVKRI